MSPFLTDRALCELRKQHEADDGRRPKKSSRVPSWDVCDHDRRSRLVGTAHSANDQHMVAQPDLGAVTERHRTLDAHAVDPCAISGAEIHDVWDAVVILDASMSPRDRRVIERERVIRRAPDAHPKGDRTCGAP